MLSASAQEKTITGIVTGADDDQPVIGVTVQIMGTTIGVATDIDGKYQISAAKGATLEFHFIGMKTQTVVVRTSDIISIRIYTMSGTLIMSTGIVTKELVCWIEL